MRAPTMIVEWLLLNWVFVPWLFINWFPPKGSPMHTALITTSIPLPESVNHLQQDVITALEQLGEPLRWSITKIVSGQVYIEAIVTCRD
jgi:hypothetical protein